MQIFLIWPRNKSRMLQLDFVLSRHALLALHLFTLLTERGSLRVNIKTGVEVLYLDRRLLGLFPHDRREEVFTLS